MKNLSTRAKLSLGLSLLALSLLPVFGVAAFALPLAGLLNLTPANGVLGASYTRINTTTIADNLADSSKAREELWVRRIMAGHDALYQDAPLSERGMFGRYQGGEQPSSSTLRKAVVEVMETRKVMGNTIHIPTMAGLGGPVTTGEDDRIGNEQKIHQGMYDIKTGIGWYGVGWTEVSRDETVLGSFYDRTVNDHLRQQIAKKKNDDHLMRLRQATATTLGARNIILPDGVTSIAGLKTANTIDTALITAMGEELPSMGAMPIDTTDDSGGSDGECFILLSPARSLAPLLNEPLYQGAQRDAGERGKNNPLFKGGYTKWNGHGIYRWITRDHANKGPIGSPLEPRARLGVALSAANTGSIIKGGGYVYSSTETPLPQYFEFFGGAYYKFFNGDTIARDTGTTRYLLIINNDGTGWNCYSYTTVGTVAADASQITILARVTLGLTGETGTYNHPQGSLVVECNVLGTPIGWTPMLGAQALVCGYGRIHEREVSETMGVRTEEIRNHTGEYAVGVKLRWGNATPTRAGDGAYPNFVMARHAVPVSGAPNVP